MEQESVSVRYNIFSLILFRIKLPLQKYLDDNKLEVEHSLGNGHCLVTSICKSLASQKNIIMSSKELFTKCKIELEENLEFYTAFYTGVDIFGEFEDHMNNNTYDLQVVDIMLQVIANTINTTVIVADIRTKNIIETMLPPRNGVSGSNNVRVIRKGEHFDALVKKIEEENGDWDNGEPGLVINSTGNFQYINYEVGLGLPYSCNI